MPRSRKITVAIFVWIVKKNLWVTNGAKGIIIPKEDGASEVWKHRTISLLNVEGKIYLKEQNFHHARKICESLNLGFKEYF